MTILLDRRTFLAGTAVTIAAATLPAIAMEADPLVLGIRYQTWPWDETRPSIDWCTGSVGYADNRLRPLSSFMKYIDLQATFGPVYWEPILPESDDD